MFHSLCEKQTLTFRIEQDNQKVNSHRNGALLNHETKKNKNV